MATPLHSFKNALESPSQGVCFENTQSEYHRSAFYVTSQCLLAMPLRCCGDACHHTVRTLAFRIFYLTPWDRRENAALV